MATDSGWQETASGLLVPPAPLVEHDIYTPQFRAFLAELNQHMPQLLDEVKKSLAAAPPLTKPLDDFGFVSAWQGVRDRQTASGLSNDTLRAMAARCPVVAAIVTTRCDQVAAFCKLPESKNDVGLKVALRDRDRQPTKAEQREMRELEDMILECSFTDVDGWTPNSPTFEHFVRAMVRDSLELDAAVVEIIHGLNRKRFPVVGFQAIDAAQIYLVEPTVYQPRKSGLANCFAVQMQRGAVVAEYAAEDIGYGLRNPCTNQARQGYGTSELEWLIGIVSSILFALDYNRTQFTSSAIPPGVISVVGNYDREALEAFKRQWRATLEGPGNQWRTPFMATKDGQGVRFERFRDSNRDMEYHQFLAFLINIACAVYNIHPEEIGMQGWAPQTTALNQPSPLSRIESSRDRGLKPILTLIANLINRSIIWQMHPDRKYIFRWVNVDPTDEETELKLRQMRLEMGLTLPRQEIADADMELHEYADVPINPQMNAVFMANLQAKLGQQMQMQQEGEVFSDDRDVDEEQDEAEKAPTPEQVVQETEKSVRTAFRRALRKHIPARKPRAIEVIISE